jgi:hypothetical protein
MKLPDTVAQFPFSQRSEATPTADPSAAALVAPPHSVFATIEEGEAFAVTKTADEAAAVSPPVATRPRIPNTSLPEQAVEQNPPAARSQLPRSATEPLATKTPTAEEAPLPALMDERVIVTWPPFSTSTP